MTCAHANYDEYFERCEDCGYIPTTEELVLIDRVGTGQVLAGWLSQSANTTQSPNEVKSDKLTRAAKGTRYAK